MSYTAFGHKEMQYLIPNEFALNPDVTPLDSHPGCVCMGGYGDAGLASCEFFFPLRDCLTTKAFIQCSEKLFPAWKKFCGSQRFQPFRSISRFLT